MMPLYLVQHGLSYPEGIDPNRSLTEEGKKAVERVAKIAAKFEIPVLRIIHSGKTRAAQTAEIMAKYLKPPFGILAEAGLNPNDDVLQKVPDLHPDKNEMIVGHLPFLERLVSYLITGTIEKRIVKFQNGGIVCLDREGNAPWFIKWILVAEPK
ncbi:MAG: phosphohistidine phosphatase SixA [Syntrophales bacterium]|nr:phosphohistidine phosphatase SixA [Syntrophales bacterium]